MRMSVSRRELRQIEFVPTWASSRTVSLSVRLRPGSRCVKLAHGIVALALSGSEVRLLCARHWRIHRRVQYRIAPRTRKVNQDHVPGSLGWKFKAVFVSQDRRVRIGWEVSGRMRRRVVQLFPKVGTRVRLRQTACIWWPTISEVDAMACLYGKPNAAGVYPQITPDQVDRMKGRLREVFLRRHPHLPPPKLGGSSALRDAGPPAEGVRIP